LESKDNRRKSLPAAVVSDHSKVITLQTPEDNGVYGIFKPLVA
jgi:hypothetical protein